MTKMTLSWTEYERFCVALLVEGIGSYETIVHTLREQLRVSFFSRTVDWVKKTLIKVKAHWVDVHEVVLASGSIAF